MLLSLRKNGLTSLFKEVRVFKGDRFVMTFSDVFLPVPFLASPFDLHKVLRRVLRREGSYRRRLCLEGRNTCFRRVRPPSGAPYNQRTRHSRGLGGLPGHKHTRPGTPTPTTSVV